MLLESLLIAIFAGIAGIDLFNGLFHIHRPIVTGAIVGLILGDLKMGLIAGATLELVWMGAVPVGGAQPPNVVVGGIIGSAFAILTKQDPATAVGIAIPFAVAVQACITLMFTFFSPVMHKADKFAEECNTSGIERINYLGMALLFVFYFIVTFLPISLGAEAAIGSKVNQNKASPIPPRGPIKAIFIPLIESLLSLFSSIASTSPCTNVTKKGCTLKNSRCNFIELLKSSLFL